MSGRVCCLLCAGCCMCACQLPLRCSQWIWGPVVLRLGLLFSVLPLSPVIASERGRLDDETCINASTTLNSFIPVYASTRFLTFYARLPRNPYRTPLCLKRSQPLRPLTP